MLDKKKLDFFFNSYFFETYVFFVNIFIIIFSFFVSKSNSLIEEEEKIDFKQCLTFWQFLQKVAIVTDISW